MSEEKYIIKIGGPGIDITKEIDAMQFARIFIILNSASDIPTNKPIPGSPVQIAGEINYSSREFLNEKRPLTNPQRILTLASFLTAEGSPRITVDNVKNEFEKAREPLPRNFTRDFNAVIKNGWLAESQETGQFYVTTTGEKIMAGTFQNDTSKKNGVGKSRKSFPSSVVIRPEIKSLNFETLSKTSNVDYWSLTKKSDKILWILIEAKTANFDSLNYKEISTLANNLGDDIPAGNINALIESHKTNSRVATPKINDVRNLRVLEPGIRYFSEFKKNNYS